MARDDNPAFASHRPTLEIAGQRFPLLARNLRSLRMVEGQGGLSSLEACFTDWIDGPDGVRGFAAHGADNPLKLGSTIMVGAGPADSPQEIFSGVITAIESRIEPGEPPTIAIMAEDLLFGLRQQRRSKLWEDKSPADICRALCEDHRLTPEVRDGLDRPVRNWMQLAQSDLAFLRSVLASVDADVQMVGDRMQAGPIADQERTALSLAAPGDLVRLRVTADIAEQHGEAMVSAIDVDGGAMVQTLATSGQMGPGEGSTAAQFLDAHFSAGRRQIPGEGPAAQDGTDVRAKAAFSRAARGFVRAEGTTIGNPELRVGSVAMISGMNPAFANRYLVVEAEHRFDMSEGYFTDFVAHCAFYGDRP